jgi:SH3-like domain-containing protein
MKLLSILILLAAMAAASVAAPSAIEYKSVGAEPVVAYDAPGTKGRKVFVAPRGMPVEVVLTYGDWTKVRDSAGDLYWLESKSLSPKRMVIVKVAGSKVRAAAEDGSAPVFSADKGVLLELLEPGKTAWLKVRHRDNLLGYVKANEVWGND